ncbi:DUF6527 family protein [Mesorhizobium sp. M0045]|uniref:DUF6527 family protein n=1 Tax=Mesorhizobium sp. M0045 TaxID=2956857 RepID=UPI003334B9FF
MARVDCLTTVFVEDIPEQLEDGVLYVSRECHVALHNCACGCGEEVSTPLVPTEYDLIMEDEGASIWPSIGNHDFPCGSHYIIKSGRIQWAGKMRMVQAPVDQVHWLINVCHGVGRNLRSGWRRHGCPPIGSK